MKLKKLLHHDLFVNVALNLSSDSFSPRTYTYANCYSGHEERLCFFSEANQQQ